MATIENLVKMAKNLKPSNFSDFLKGLNLFPSTENALNLEELNTLVYDVLKNTQDRGWARLDFSLKRKLKSIIKTPSKEYAKAFLLTFAGARLYHISVRAGIPRLLRNLWCRTQYELAKDLRDVFDPVPETAVDILKTLLGLLDPSKADFEQNLLLLDLSKFDICNLGRLYSGIKESDTAKWIPKLSMWPKLQDGIIKCTNEVEHFCEICLDLDPKTNRKKRKYNFFLLVYNFYEALQFLTSDLERWEKPIVQKADFFDASPYLEKLANYINKYWKAIKNCTIVDTQSLGKNLMKLFAEKNQPVPKILLNR